MLWITGFSERDKYKLIISLLLSLEFIYFWIALAPDVYEILIWMNVQAISRSTSRPGRTWFLFRLLGCFSIFTSTQFCRAVSLKKAQMPVISRLRKMCIKLMMMKIVNSLSQEIISFYFFPWKVTYHAAGKNAGEGHERKGNRMKVILSEKSMKSTWCKHKFHYIHFHCYQTRKNTCKDSINCHYWIFTWKAFLFIDKIHSLLFSENLLTCVFSEKPNGECIKNIDDGKRLQRRIPSTERFTLFRNFISRLFSTGQQRSSLPKCNY